MKKRRKKLIILVLVLTMCTSLVPNTISFAEELDNTQEKITNVVQITDETGNGGAENTTVTDVNQNGIVAPLEVATSIIKSTASDKSEISATYSVTSTSANELLLGDVNGDGKVNIIDYIVLKKYIDEGTNTINKENADMNQDTKVNILDYLALGKIILAGQNIKVTLVTINETSLDLTVGQTKTLSTTVSPETATNRTLTWESSNTSVAKVNADGKVEAIASGAATIKCTSSDGSGLFATCEVVVTAPIIKVTSVSIDKTGLDLKLDGISNGQLTLAANISPDNASNKTVTWTSSDPRIATVDEIGNITGIRTGTVTITCTSNDNNNCYGTSEIRVEELADKNYTFDEASKTITKYIGNSNEVIIPSKIHGIEVLRIGDSAFSNRFTVTSIVIPNTVTSIGEFAFGRCQSLKNIEIPNSVTSIGVEAFYGCTGLTSVTVPNSVISISYYAFQGCSNAVYYVESQRVKALLIYGFADESKIIVKTPPSEVKVTSITLGEISLNIEKGNEVRLTASAVPDNASNKAVTWKSSNTSVATVVADGTVVAVGAGKATITCTASDESGVFSTCEVTVPEELKITAKATDITMTTATLDWAPSRADVAIADYVIYQGDNYLTVTSIKSTDELTYNVTGLDPNTSYRFRVYAYGPAGNPIASTVVDVTTVVDSVAPLAPTELTSSSVTGTSLMLSWTAATDNARVTGYDIYNGNEFLETIPSTYYNVTGLTQLTTYNFTVRARDASGNISSASEPLSVKTLDNEAPTAPTNVKVTNVSYTNLTLTWEESTDNVGVTKYEIWNGTSYIGTATGVLTYDVTRLVPNTSYNFTVRACDAAGNSKASTALSVTTLVDVDAPTVPTKLTASSVKNKSFTLSWTAATDNAEGIVYYVYNGIEFLGTATSTHYNVEGLMPFTTYGFTVKAKDVAGNISEASEELKVLTAEGIPPTAPMNLTATEVGCTVVTITWTKSTDNIGVTKYDLYKGDGIVSTIYLSSTSSSISTKVSGLSAETEYTFTVKATDEAGNVSAASTALTVVTLKPSDLIITDISYSPSMPFEGEDITFVATIKNIGAEATDDGILHKIEFTLDGVSGIFWTGISTKSIKPGEYITIRATAGSMGDKWKALAGTHTIHATIDKENLIYESNNQNNSYSEKMVIEEPCDLIVTNVLILPGNPINGEEVKLSATIKNIGKSTSPTGRIYRVGFYIDGNEIATIWADDFDWSIEPQQSVTVTATAGTNSFKWIATTGNHEIKAIVDDVNLIKESNEENNIFTKNITVTDTRVYDQHGDYDGDGISNIHEQFWGTDYLNPDTDGDNISDFDEINKYLTDPLSADTDKDGLYDGTEIKLILDPITADDKTEATRNTKTMDEKTSVTVYGDSNILVAPFQMVNVENILLNSLEGIIGKPVEISLGGYKMGSANITFNYNKSELNNISPEDITIYWVDVANKKLVPLLDSDIILDEASGTITGKVTHFSIYTLGKRIMKTVLNDTQITYATDKSQSMGYNDPDNYRLKLIRRLMQGTSDSLCYTNVMGFSSEDFWGHYCPDNDIDHFDESFANLANTHGMKNLGELLTCTLGPFVEMDSIKVLILISDGESDYQYSDEEVVDIIQKENKEMNAIIFTVGVGSNIDGSLLKKIASVGNGEYFNIDPEKGNLQIEALYFKILKELRLKQITGTIFDPITKEREWNDSIMDLIKETPTYQWFVEQTQNGELPTFFDLGGFDRDENGVYHAKQDGWQSLKYVGYNEIYDQVFDLATSMERKIFQFSAGGEKFRIWLWKGDYLNLGAGAEVGIYYGGGPQWFTGTQYAMPMTLSLKDNEGNQIFSWNPEEENWWITGFNPNYQEVQASNLTAYGKIDFSQNLDVYDAFYEEHYGDPILTFDTENHIATFKW